MIIRLDPFHLIRAINCPEPAPEVLVVNAFRMTLLTPPDPGSDVPITRTLCSGGNKTVNLKTHWWFGNDEGAAFSSPLYSCAQMKMVAVGRTSGARHDMHGEEKAFLGFEDCLENACWIETPYGMSRHRVFNSPGGGFLTTDWQEYSTQDPGFTKFERCNVEMLAGPILEIVSIENAVSAGVIVTTLENHVFAELQRVKILGTTKYNGDYEVLEIVTTNSFRIDSSKLGSDTGGTVQPDYDPI